MTQAYTPGLRAAASVSHRVRRLLPLEGEVRVNVGNRVQARDVVAETLMPGNITPVNLAQLLAASPDEVSGCLIKRVGERVEKGELLARSKGMFGMFQQDLASPFTGTIEAVSSITGQMIVRGPPIPVQVKAYLTGEVVEVIPKSGCSITGPATVVQGIFGIGGEAYGPIVAACSSPAEPLTPQLLKPEMKGAIVIGGARVTAEALRRGVEIGVSAMITGGIDDEDLKNFLGYDLGVAVTGTELTGLTLILTEGFGDIGMAERTYKLLTSRVGSEAAVNGATQIRAGVMRPEILIPWAANQADLSTDRTDAGGALQIGLPVRIVRDPYFGKIGKIRSLPPEPRTLASGSKARILEVELSRGETVIVPRANVELVEVEPDGKLANSDKPSGPTPPVGGTRR